MKFKDYVVEGKAKFHKGGEEYFIREVGMHKYEVAVFLRGDTPDNVYTVQKKGGGGWMCNCPARGPKDKHIKLVQEWLKAGKPSDFGKDVKGDVLKGLKKMGVKL